MWKKLKNSNCEKNQKKSNFETTQIITKLKTQIVTKLTSSICDKTQIMTQLKAVVMVTVVTVVIVTVVSVLIVTVVTVVIVSVVWVKIVTIAVVTVVVGTFFSKKTSHLQNRWDFSGQLFAISRSFFLYRAKTNSQIFHYFMPL